MKQVTTLYFLLVCCVNIFIVDYAQADVRPLNFHENKLRYTKIPSNRNEIENNNNKNEENFPNNKPATTQYSVVEDSQLLCQELCGANLGGPTCGAYCKTNEIIPIRDIIIRNKLLKALQQHEAEICSTLCQSGLGRPHCKCRTVRNTVDQKQTSDMSHICDTFCQQSMLTMPGCSECRVEGNPETTSTTITTTTTLAPTTSGTTTPSSTSVETTTTAEAVTSNLTDQSTSDTSETVTTVTTPATTTTTTPASTTTTSTTITTTAKTEEPTTEPNWDELCASLCKIGEGGALCNCDLPPFFK